MFDYSHHHVDNHINSHTHVISLNEQKRHAIINKFKRKNYKQQSPGSSPKKNKKHKASINISKFTHTLTRNARNHSTQKCAKNVRIALESAGAHVQSHPVAASDWGATLERIGYKRITPAFQRPKEGDIYIISKTKKHTYGHIAGYTNRGWISDFKQNSYAIYHGSATYKYYRMI